jgi:hypothetical protein
MIQFFWDGLLNSEDEGITKGRELFFQRYGVASQRNLNLHYHCESLKSEGSGWPQSLRNRPGPGKKIFYHINCSLVPMTRSASLLLLTICLLGLMFMGPCIVRILWYIANKMQRYTVLFYLETALRDSGGTSTHHQERKQLYLQHCQTVTTTCRYSGR